MKPITHDQLLGQLNWRYATKVFDPAQKISPENWAALEESLVLSPSSYGLQLWSFLVIENPDIRRQLQVVSAGRTQVVDASHLVVFAIKRQFTESDVDAHIDRVVAIRSVTRESMSAFRNMVVTKVLQGMDDPTREAWMMRQVYIALGTFVTSAAMLGIDTCPMEGIQPDQYDVILDMPARQLKTVVAAAAGYRSVTDKYASAAKVRFPKEDVIRYV